MKREPISYYLRNPSKLVDLSVSQIQKWLQESPYSQPLRTLLAKKLHYNQEVVMDNSIASAAATASNRTWLYRELYGRTEFITENSGNVTAIENLGIVEPLTAPIVKEALIHEVEVENVAELDVNVVKKDIEDIHEDTDDINHLVDYEEVVLDKTLDQVALATDNEVDLIENEVDETDVIEPVTEVQEDIIEPLPTIETKELTPILATMDVVESAPKLIDLNQSISTESNTPKSEIKIVRVETDEDFVAGRDEKKKKSKGKKAKKAKKGKDEKVKKKKAKKKSSDKDKKVKEKKKSKKKKNSKKKGIAKPEKKKSKKLKALEDYWDGNKENTSIKPQKELKPKKKKKSKNKKPKVELLKYSIPVSPIDEEANNHQLDTSEMSDYTQWLLRFSKNKPGSFNHMTAASKTSSNRIENISFLSSKSTSKSKKTKKKKKSNKKGASKIKNKSKIDHSLDTNEEIISELWADLLAKQGHIKKARKMYLKLSLKYPEKSSYFASKLEKL